MRGRLTGSLTAGLLLALALVVPVAGHGELESTSPAANDVLAEAPESLILTFTEPVDIVTVAVDLLDDDGALVPGLGTLTADEQDVTLTVPLPPLPAGIYTVAYRVVSAVDGHVVEGSYAFGVDPTGTLPAPGSGAESFSPSSTPAAVAARWLALLAGLALLGTALAWLVTIGPPAAPPWRGLLAAALVALGALEAYLVLAALPVAPDNWTAGFPFASPFGGTSFAWAMRLAVAGALVAASIAGWAVIRRSGGKVAATGLAIAAAVSLAGSSLAGHASALGGPTGAALDWLHLLAAALWLGGLPYLAQAGGSAMARHTRVALVAAPLVVLTGIANSPLVLGSARGLAATDYGNAIIAKALVFSVAVAIGAANFFLLRSGRWQRAVRLVAVEAVVGTLAVAVAATLVTGVPAASRPLELVRSPVGVAQLTGTEDGVTVRMAVNLPSPGVQRYQVSVADATTGAFLTDVTAVRATFAIGRGPPGPRVTLTQSADPWLWGTTGELTPAVGPWTISVEVERLHGHSALVFLELQTVPERPAELVPPASTGIRVPVPLAWLWDRVPQGPVAWAIPGLLLAALAATTWSARRRDRFRGAQLALVVLVVLAGLTVASREAWSAATEPPADARAEANPVAGSAESVERGRNLYLANCASCHGTGGAGDGPAAEGMLPSPGDLASSVPAETDGGLAYLIAVGIAGTDMPPFSDVLSPADRWDLVNYLRAAWPGP